MLTVLKSISLLILCHIYTISSTKSPEVTIEQGTVRGLYDKTFNNHQFISFLGIPYAKPPIGHYRFREPEPADPWVGAHEATKEPPSCIQLDLFLTKSKEGSEDCLYINVYTPKLPENRYSNGLDVIVFIHGGAYYSGKSGHQGPSLLLNRNIVLVTFNYRLGPLGFLSTQDEVVPGNNGLKDQVLALKWVKKNIAAFGGNPKSVTIAGISAGGSSCHYHTLSPLSKGLFKGAICMNGVTLNPWTMVSKPQQITKFFANHLGCLTNDSLHMIECLRSLSADHIIESTKIFMNEGMMPLIFLPVVEPPSSSAFISDLPINIIKRKEGMDVPIIMSFADKEGLVIGAGIITKPPVFNHVMEEFGEIMPHFLVYNHIESQEIKARIGKKIKEFYKIQNDSKDEFIKMLGDRNFVSGISKAAKITASVNTSPVYLYKISYRGKRSLSEIIFSVEEDLGVCHCDDILYTLGFAGFYNAETAEDIKVSDQLLDIWVSFAANGTLGENWQPINYKSSKIAITNIKGPDDFQLTEEEELGEERFWDSLGLDENLGINDVKKDEL